ncbi:lysylphosphatidylglycerol synthase domain-containing protein [Carboxylicivirga caseinilyticus]|uniref:lysylphosphatidylglycerol synthase domain-containing protein n=1 Tax=Carboxylicivirga caseinilyticus TaxID=3417572 RepID=UPI003D34D515|nr:flippase-like domain-containing protein [Marinilabiliaceae bacterium A049]
MQVSWLRNRILKRLIFYLISLAAYYFIYDRLINFQYWDKVNFTIKFGWYQANLILVFLLLWILNILSETKKWQVLIGPFIKISFRDALKQFFAGSFTAVGSPARVAEPGGRMLLIQKEQRIHALLMTSTGGLIQNIVIGFFGIIAFYMVGVQININLNNNYLFILIIPPLFIGLFLVILRIYFRDRMKTIWAVVKKIKSSVLINATFLTIVRYMVFNLQLIIVMILFAPELDFVDVLQLSPVYFFVITLIPSFLLADVGIRGSAAILVFARLGVNEPVLLIVILGLWVFNVVFPALIGGVILHIKKGL